MKWFPLTLPLAVGALGGFASARLRGTPRIAGDVDEAGPLLAGQPSGPGITCPSANDPAAFASYDPADAPLRKPRPIREGPTCSVRPLKAHRVFDRAGRLEDLPDSDIFWFGTYRGQPPEKMGDRSMVEGVSTEVAQVVTGDDPEAVKTFFQQQLEMNQIRYQTGLPMGLSGPLYMSFTRQSKNTLILVPRPSGTVILAAVSDPKGDPTLDEAIPQGVPAPDGAREIHVHETQEGPSRQHDVTFMVDEGFEEVRSFYMKQLPAKGYLPDDGARSRQTKANAEWHQVFEREGESFTVNLAARGAKLVSVTLLWINVSAPPESRTP